MSKYAKATQGPSYEDRYPGSVMKPNAGVIHTTEGTSLPTYSGGAVAPNYTAVPDFKNKRLVWHNHFPDERSSRALENHAGGVETNTLNVVQVELVGTCAPGIHADWEKRGIQHIYWPEAPDWALDDVADFIADMHRRHGIKIAGPKTWTAYPDSYGAGGQRFTNAQWRAFYGWCGHQHVPENVHGDPGAFPWAKVEAKAKALVGDKPAPKPAPKADAKPTRIQRFLQGGPKYDLSLLDDAVKGGRKGTVEDVRDGIDAQIKRLPKDPDKNSRVNKVRKSAEKDRILRMGALHNAIKAGRTGTVKEVRDTIQDLIKRLPKD